MNITLVTGNPNKALEFQSILGQTVETVALDLPEIQSTLVEEVVREKAQEAYRRIGRPVLVEDTGLAFAAWNGLPGALVRWFFMAVGNDGLCHMLAGFTNRRATATTCLGYADGQTVRVFTGQMEGTIAPAPRGTAGFGWDPIFIPDGTQHTFAELTPEEKDTLSMRKLAVEELRRFLST